MYFDYAGYVLECLNIPVQQLVFITFSLGSLIWAVRHSGLSRRGAWIIGILIGVWIGGFACMHLGHLYHGGIYLIKERESDAIQMQGNISEIKELGDLALPIIECDYYDHPQYGDPNGYQFTVNGIRCTAPVKGSLKVGDYVSVTYLPRSGYILYIDRVEQ